MSLKCPDCQRNFPPAQTPLFLWMGTLRCGGCGRQVTLNSTGRMRLIVSILLGFLLGILFGAQFGHRLVVGGAVALGALAGMIGAWYGGELKAVDSK